MFSRLTSAVKGEDQFEYGKKGVGSKILTRIAKASQALQRRRAAAALKKDKTRRSTIDFGEVETEAPEAEWWSGVEAVSAPSDPAPFEKTDNSEEEEESAEDDENYGLEVWPEDYDYNTWQLEEEFGDMCPLDEDEAGFDAAFALTGGVDEGSAAASSSSSSKAVAMPSYAQASVRRGDTSEDEEDPQPMRIASSDSKQSNGSNLKTTSSKGKSKKKGKAKATPKAQAIGKSADPWADSDGSQESPTSAPQPSTPSAASNPAASPRWLKLPSNHPDLLTDSGSDQVSARTSPRASPKKPLSPRIGAHASDASISATTDTVGARPKAKTVSKNKIKPKTPKAKNKSVGEKLLLEDESTEDDSLQSGKIMF